jgi:hypothetical protein
MRLANATHLVLVDAELFPRFEANPHFESLARIGPYLVLGLRGAASAWGTVTGGAGTVDVERPAPGELHVATRGSVESVSLSEAFHPFWRVEPARSARLRSDANGLMVLDHLASPRSPVTLVYSPPALPGYLTLGGAGLIACLFAAALLVT